MKLCQRCSDAIKEAGGAALKTEQAGNLVVFIRDLWPDVRLFAVNIVPESECEFYLHKKLNELQEWLEKKDTDIDGDTYAGEVLRQLQ